MAKKYKLTQVGEEVQALLNKIEGIKANQTPEQGVTPTPMENLALDGVLYAFLTKSVNDLANYYLKSETYTKSEVNLMVAAIKQFTIQSVDQLPQPSAETVNILYLVPAEEPKVANEKDEFITVIKDGSYAWEQVGSTAIDLSGYVTTDALNTALADYVTSDALSTALAGLHDVKYTVQSLTDAQKAQARTNIGATAPEVFLVEYGTTLASDIENAISAGKICIIHHSNNRVYIYTRQDGGYYYFVSSSDAAQTYISVNKTSSAYSTGTLYLQNTNQKSQSVETDKDSTAKYPSTKAVADAIATGKQIFLAVYGETTVAELDAAIAANKVVFLVRNSYVYRHVKTENDFYCFAATYGGRTYNAKCNRNNGAWTAPADFVLENTANKSQSIETDKTSTSKYPSVKAVYDKLKMRPIMDSEDETTIDPLNLESANNKVQSLAGNESNENKYPSTKALAAALGKWGVVSQTITWSGSASDGYEASVSNAVMGLIPRFFIDLVTAEGAVFNDTTGYFELNGITDIAYDEMREIYAKKTGLGQTWVGSIYHGSRYTARTCFAVFRGFSLSYSNHPPVVMKVKYMGCGKNGAGNNSTLVVLALHDYDGILYGAGGGEFGNCFSGNNTIKKILGQFNVSNGGTLFYPNAECRKLETFYMRSLSANLSLIGMPSLLVSTIAFMVQYAANTNAITITLHATAYARCVADTAEYTYNGQTYTGVIALANAKNITIASA